MRLIKNKFFNDLQELYAKCPSTEALKELLGRARAKKGMFEGDLTEGELEIGQIAGLIHEIKPVDEIFEMVLREFEEEKNKISSFIF